MKHTIILLLLCCLGLGAQAQGIRFTEGSWKEILEKAAKEKKLVFLDCYTSWCQPCRKLAGELFPLKAAGDFYNRHFINVKMDMQRGEGPMLTGMYHVHAYPTLLFIDAEGNQVYRSEGCKNLDALLETGRNALEHPQKVALSPEARKQLDLVGRQVPDFGLADADGRKVKFSSLRGKYVYIDVWATWCRPCCAEIPYMGELEKKFHGRNIHFVSVSCDRNLEAWKKKVKEDGLGGIQLNTGTDAEFARFFGIRGIPRFILLDKEGRVINSNMTRPSQEVTEESLKALKGI